MDGLNARDLHKDSANRKRHRLSRIFTSLLKRCCAEIQKAHRSGKDYVIFNVPLVAPIDEPLYKCTECITYLKQELSALCFETRVMEPGNRLWVAWDAKAIARVNARNAAKRSDDFQTHYVDLADAEQVRGIIEELRQQLKR